jgi:tRNA threonylcarbamoyladenosine biosynthesis protein TsaE
VNIDNHLQIEKISYRLVHRLVSTSASQTLHIAGEWAALLHPGNVVAFYGNLGSGKTTFIRGLCSGLNVTDGVSSPTFTLVNEYQGLLRIYHLDLYRITTLGGLKDIGLEEYFYSDGVCLVEWPEIVQSILPAGHQAIRLSFDFDKLGPEARIIEVLQHNDSRD